MNIEDNEYLCCRWKGGESNKVKLIIKEPWVRLVGDGAVRFPKG